MRLLRARVASDAAKRLFALKNLALHDLMNQGSEAVILAADVADDRLNLGPVGRRGGCARGVAEQLFGQGAGQLVLVGEQQLLVLVDVLKPSAVRQHVGGVDLRAVPISLFSAVD